MGAFSRSALRQWALLLCTLAGPVFALAEEKAEPTKFDPKLQELYLQDAQRWEMWVDQEQTRKAELVTEPVFRWQNLTRANGQSGAMFVWTDRGRPVVIGGVFSNPEGSRRVVMQEFHALGPDRLFPVFRDSESKWLPGAGVQTSPLPESPAVAETAPQRTLQIRAISRDFTAHVVDDQQQRGELRLLPRPLYRYEKPEGDVVDGALLAFVSDTGTDPEIILMLEGRREGGESKWHYRAVRLSISDLHVEYRGNPVWSSLRNDPEGMFGNKDNTYGLIRDRLIDE
jgi:hypothetical protein